MIHRKKVKWTDEEKSAVKSGVKKYGTQWKLIKKMYPEVLERRTKVQIKVSSSIIFNEYFMKQV